MKFWGILKRTQLFPFVNLEGVAYAGKERRHRVVTGNKDTLMSTVKMLW